VGLNSVHRVSRHPDVVLAALQLQAVNRDHVRGRVGAGISHPRGLILTLLRKQRVIILRNVMEKYIHIY
jgi:hypothetical protein